MMHDTINPFVAETIEDAIESLVDSAASHQHFANFRRERPDSPRNMRANQQLDLACEVDTLLQKGNVDDARSLLHKHGITVRWPSE